MLSPSILNNRFNSMDHFFEDMFAHPFGERSYGNMMNTDIKDLGEHYQLDVELPGFEKKDIQAELKNGYLTVSAVREENKEEKEQDSPYIRRERYSGSMSRSFYVGDGIKEEEIHAGFENGVLRLSFPKENIQQKLENKKFIAIE